VQVDGGAGAHCFGEAGMTKDEALELALEALEMYLLETNSDFQRKAVRAIKQALAAPVQEPAITTKHKENRK
jgi:hypothetical protein